MCTKLSKTTNPQTQLTGITACGTAITTPPTPNIYVQLFERNHLRTPSSGDHVWCPSKGRMAWRSDYHYFVKVEMKIKSKVFGLVEANGIAVSEIDRKKLKPAAHA